MATAAKLSMYQPLPPTRTVTVSFASCPVCGRSDFRHPKHRRNHIAKCGDAAIAADAAAGVFECEEMNMDHLLPASMIAQANRTLRVVEPDLHSTAQRMAQDVAARLVDYIEGVLGARDPHLEAAGRSIELHIEAAYWIGEVAWDVSPRQDRHISAITDALQDYIDWSRAVEDDRYDVPTTWDMDVEQALEAALEAARCLADYCKPNADTGCWTVGAYDQVEAANAAASRVVSA